MSNARCKKTGQSKTAHDSFPQKARTGNDPFSAQKCGAAVADPAGQRQRSGTFHLLKGLGVRVSAARHKDIPASKLRLMCYIT